MKTSESSSIKKQMQFWSASARDYYRDLYEDVKEYPSLVLRHQYILDLLKCKEGGTILDIGCGPGEMLRDLLEKGFAVHGVDISEGMLRVASDNLADNDGKRKFTLQCGNIEALHFRDKSFDAVICAGVIEYLDSDDVALQELNRILKNNGSLIITVRNKACPFRVLDILIDKLKEHLPRIPFLGFLMDIMGKKQIRYIPYRKHYPWELDKNLQKHGLVKSGFRYFHFYPFFIPCDTLFPSAFINLGLRMEKLSSTRFGILGSGYIVKAQKVRDV